MKKRPCTPSLHGAITADPARFATELSNHRPWPEAGLELAECQCASTLARELDEAAHGD